MSLLNTEEVGANPDATVCCATVLSALLLTGTVQAGKPAEPPDSPFGSMVVSGALAQPTQPGSLVINRTELDLTAGNWPQAPSLIASQNGPAASPTSPADSAGEGGGGDADLAKKLANPIADLISLPFQSNFQFGGGPDNDAFSYLLNIQPVIPVTLNKDWNLISRTILPVLAQDNVIGTSSSAGLGDTLQSFFFSPKSGTPFIWGAGPVALLPTATDDSLGTERWGLGPTVVMLKQAQGWTIGCLTNHVWGFQQSDGRSNVNASYLQPFLSYTFRTATTATINTESTYDWNESQWTMPVYAGVGQLVRLGGQPVNLKLGAQYWLDGPDTAPEWGIRFETAFLFQR